MITKDKPNKVTTTLKVVITGEFYDDEASEETVRYAIEQDLEDAGFDVDVAILKEQESKQAVITTNSYGTKFYHCPRCNRDLYAYPRQSYCSNCGQAVKWD